MPDCDAWVAAACRARDHAAAPFSHFRVGAVVVTGDGRVYGGSNVESASYGLTMCAERVALFTALADGARTFRAVVVVTEAAEPTPPCGACRQLLWEYCGDVEVLLADPSGVRDRMRLADLLPRPFDGRSLG